MAYKKLQGDVDMKKMLLCLVALSAWAFSACAASTCQDNPLYCNWLAYYGKQAADFQPFDPIVLDADIHPDLAPWKSIKTLLGYLSVGEIASTRPYFKDARAAGVLISQDPNNPGAWYVDVRKAAWRDMLINTIIPSILNQGFKGLLLDTLDASIYLERVNPIAYRGMIDAAVNLVFCIHNAFPQAKLMLSDAYPILNRVGGYIDYALGNTVLTWYDPKSELYYYTTREMYESAVSYLRNAKVLFPSLTLMSLDYWNPNDPYTITQIYRRERQNGFRPYVGPARLQQIVLEPQ